MTTPDTIRTSYAGDTADHYRRFAEAGLAPQIISVTDDEIEAVRHQTLSDWLANDPTPQQRNTMKQAIQDLLVAAHKTGFCHRDVRVENIVVTDDHRPLLIDPAYATPSVNEHCYDLVGPEASGIEVPDDHVKQRSRMQHGIWWGSPETHRSLQAAFGPPPMRSTHSAPPP